MIFVAKADGGVTYVSPEWTAYTGQPAAEAVEHGWFRCMHPEDYQAAVTFLREARDQQSEYSLRVRLRRANGVYVWVMIGAVPSYGPPDHRLSRFAPAEIGPNRLHDPPPLTWGPISAGRHRLGPQGGM
ncbi:PAS domain-containing protein [Methylobacterium sp. A49B]